MKKKSRRSIEKKLDTEFSRVIRLRDKCARCGKGADTITLQCAHIISRVNRAVRWDLENGVPLCYACHIFWAHRNPVDFVDFIKDYLGELRFEALKARARVVKKWTIEEMEEYLKYLQEIRH